MTEYLLDFDEPAELEPEDYLSTIEGGGTVLHIYLKDDKEWYLAHNPHESPPGELNGPWFMWSKYPTGAWTLDYCTREVLHFHVDELYYVDYDGQQAHSVHEIEAVEPEQAPEFVASSVGEPEENVND